MKKNPFIVLILLGVLVSPLQSSMTATLNLVSNSPLVFVLTFSEEVMQPVFQLLLNNIYVLEYTVVEQRKAGGSVFTLQCQPSLQTTSLEEYNLIFNFPLGITNLNSTVSLSPASYTLTAQKGPIAVSISPIFSIIVLLGMFWLVFSNVLGSILVEFVQAFILLSSSSQTSNTMIPPLTSTLFLLPTLHSEAQNIYFKVVTPILLLLLSLGIGFIGVAIERTQAKEAGGEAQREAQREMEMVSVKQSNIKETLTHPFEAAGGKTFLKNLFMFDLFAVISKVYLFSLFFNSLTLITYVQKGASGVGVTIFLAIVGLVVYVGMYSLMGVVLNAGCIWEGGRAAKVFEWGRVWHEGAEVKQYHKRNNWLFGAIKVTLQVLIYFTTSQFVEGVIILEFLHAFFLFNSRPFTKRFQMNAAISLRIAIFAYFSAVGELQLYFSQDRSVFNNASLLSFYLFQNIGFLLLSALIFIFGLCGVYLYFRQQKKQEEPLSEKESRSITVSRREDEMENSTIRNISNLQSVKQSPLKNEEPSSPKVEIVSQYLEKECRKKRTSSIGLGQSPRRARKQRQKEGSESPSFSRKGRDNFVELEGGQKNRWEQKGKWKERSLLAQIVRSDNSKIEEK